MKVRKLLSAIIAGAMVLGTMAFPVFAANEPYTVTAEKTLESVMSEINTSASGDVVINLETDATLQLPDYYANLVNDDVTSLTINGNSHTLDVDATYRLKFNMAGTLKLNNVTVKSDYFEANTWDSWDFLFNCDVEFTNVIFNREMALEKNAVLTGVTINNSSTDDSYAIWIPATQKTVVMDNVTINAAGTGKRGIKIDEQYINEENIGVVNLTVKNSTFNTYKKSAILVKSKAGANIVASNNNIENVNDDTTNLVWVDSDLPASYPKVKVTIDGEPVAPYLEDAGTGVACIGNSYYMTLTNALDAAQNGDVVDLLGGTIVLKDTGVTTVPINKNITIKNGTFDITDFVAEHSNSIFDIYGGAKVTFEDVDFTGSNYSSSYGVIYAHETSKVTLNNCDFELDTEKDTAKGGVLKGNDYAKDRFVVNNCNFTLNNTSRVFALMTIDMNGGSINATHKPISEEHAFRDVYGTIDDATISFDNFQNGIKNTKNAALTFTNSTVSSANMAEYDLQLAGGATVSGVAFVNTNCKAVVASIGTTYYATLEDAFAAAQEGEVITLLADATPTLTSQRAITKASVIDLNGKTLTLTEDDLYFGTTTFKNGNIVVDPSVEARTAVFWMFENQTLTFDNVILTASGVSGTYLIGLDGDNADLNLLNKSEIIVENNTALDLDIICVSASTGNDIVIDNSKVSVTNLDGRVFFGGNYTVSGNSDIDLIGITKAGFRIEAGQSLNILDTATVDIEGEPRDGGIHIVKLPATYSKSDTATVNATFNTPTASAKIDNTKFATLQSALDAANAGDIIVLECDVSEKIVIAAPAVAALAANDDAIVIDLAGKTLNGYILIQDANKNIEIKNGNIINEDSTESAIESVGTLTVTDVNITSARHAINVEGGNAEINGGNFALIQKDVLTQNVIGAENAVVIINDGVFTGPAGTTADSGAAVAAKTGSTVTINGGKFSGGKNNTIAVAGKGTLVVNGGMFDQDVTAYIAETSEAIDRGAYEYPYGVAPKAAGKINVALKATDNKNVYNIVITSADEYDINEFVSAELTFKNESTTVGGSVMDYKINGYADNKTFAQEAKDAVGLKDNEEQYIISLNDGAKRLSSTDAKDGDGIIIGQVEFFGQGDIKFSVTKGEVDTTWQNTNLGRYYTTEVVAPATEATLGIENASINSNVPEVHRDVAVNVAFNHNIDTNDYWKGYQIEVTLKNSAMGKEYKKTLEIKDIKTGACVFEDVPVGYITVTLKAPGFRTYTYNTTLEETKDNGVLVLNFWNDVKKGNDEAIEKGKDKMAHNFLVGDIVMDMKVDKYDLAAVTSYYGTYGIDKAEAEKYIKYDLNRDGDIDIRDVQYVLHTMGN